jgi:hypothetical protein
MRSFSQPQAREWRAVCVTVIAAASWLAIGCHAAPKPIEAAPCVGTPYLLVRNATGGAVDVYYSGVTPYLIGTARPGPTELTLPPSVDANGYFRARRPDGQWIVAAFGGQREASRISFQIRCR